MEDLATCSLPPPFLFSVKIARDDGIVEGAEQEQEQRWWPGVGMLIVINMSGKEGRLGH